MPSQYEDHVDSANEHIVKANRLVANPDAGSPEQAQTEATLAVAQALLAIGVVVRRIANKS